VYKLLVGNRDRKRPLERPRRRWVDDIKIDLVEIVWSDLDWIGLARDRVKRRDFVNAVMKLQVL
jgi:hypothetical protein